MTTGTASSLQNRIAQCAATTAIATLAMCGAVFAQADAAAEDATILAPLMVSARHIEEPVQRIPFAITAIDGQEILSGRMNSTQALVRRTPNVNHADSGLPFSNLVNMRGIGSSSALISPSVQTYLDGIPVPSRMSDMPVGDLQRVEIMRGPQGTHFGLNAQAGVISRITRDPASVAAGEVGVLFGQHGRKELDFSLEGPLADTVSGRIAGRLHDFDGDLTNVLWSAPGVISSSRDGLRSRTYGALSGKLLFEPTASDRLTLFGGWSRDRQNPTTGAWLDDPEFPRNALNPVPRSETETTHLGARYEHDFDWGRLTSISGLYHYSTELEADIVDGFIGSAQTGLPGFAFQAPGVNVRRIDETSTQLSQELRLDGETAGGTRWVGGLSGVWSRFNSTTDITSLALANGGYRGMVDTANVAAFGEVTVPVSERVNWIGGLRLTHESKDFSGRFLGRAGALARFEEDGRKTYDFLTGRTGLTFDITNDVTAFATVARGEKTGGYLFYNQFAAMGIPLRPYRSSNTWSYEAGVKGTDVGGWLDLGASVFYNDTSDEQLFTFNPVLGRFSVENADTRSYGAELELTARPTAEWSFGASLALLQAQIRGGNKQIRGNDVPYAPSVGGSLHAEYRRALDIGTHAGSGFLRAEYAYTGIRQIDPANSRKLDGYGLVNVRVGWQGERFEAFAAVENVFDQRYVTSAFQAGTDTAGRPIFAGIPGQRRSFSVGARVRF